MGLIDPWTAAEATGAAADADWWRGAVIYQIYPRSFQDSNGDGVGDLSGIIHRLDHVRSLGVDAIWVSPFFRSPMRDFGYDVSDYRDVDPLFGTLDDFDALIARAHELGLRVLIDLVLSHTSQDHPWFRESSTNATNGRADWYVWADPKPDGTPPNNWLSIFGGPAWQWSTTRMQYYLHNFLVSQPDLNFHCAAVQDALLDVARYWLNRGVDGFRLDTANFYVHDAGLRDNPVLPPAARNDKGAPAVNPYNFQDHVYDKNRPETLEFLRRLRDVLDAFPGATSVGEIGESQRGLELQAAYTAGNEFLHMAYDFDLLSGTAPTGTRIADILQRFQDAAPDGWACWAFSNHDVTRHVTRWDLNEEARRVYAAVLLCMRGSVCLYQGDELGLTEAYVAYEDLQDPYGREFWPRYMGRDGCRTPMPWVRDIHAGGFTDAKPWLPVAMEHLGSAVSVQDTDPGSTLNFHRALIAYRQATPALRTGAAHIAQADDETLVLVRSLGNVSVLCAFNLSDRPQTLRLPPGDWRPDTAAPLVAFVDGDTVVLPAYGAHFATRAGGI